MSWKLAQIFAKQLWPTLKPHRPAGFTCDNTAGGVVMIPLHETQSVLVVYGKDLDRLRMVIQLATATKQHSP